MRFDEYDRCDDIVREHQSLGFRNSCGCRSFRCPLMITARPMGVCETAGEIMDRLLAARFSDSLGECRASWLTSCEPLG